MAIAALILGIAGVIFDFVFFPVGLICSIVAVILGALGRKKPEGKGLATAGLVLGIVGLVLGIIALVCTILCATAIAVSGGSVIGGLAGLAGMVGELGAM